MRASYYRAIATLVALCFPEQRTAADSPWFTRSSQPASETSVAAASAAGRPPLYLEVWPTVHDHGASTPGPFVADIALHTGDAIQLRVRTSAQAHVYLLHCDANAALSIYPDAGGILFHADQWVALPPRDMPIRLGPKSGVETLYIISTLQPLVQTQPKLFAHLTAMATAGAEARCDETLTSLLAEPPPASEDAAQTKPKAATRRTRYALRGIDITRPSSPVVRAFGEQDGLVILRLPYQNKPNKLGHNTVP